MAASQELADCYESCSYICTFRFFTKNEGEFFGWGAVIKLGKYFVYFGIVVVSDGLVFGAVCEEVQLCFDLSQNAVGAESLLTGEPGLSAPARLYGQSVLAESVHRQCFPEFDISHCAQVVCHGVLSI